MAGHSTRQEYNPELSHDSTSPSADSMHDVERRTCSDQRFGPEQSQELEAGLCPVAETSQSQLLQFKTNYFDPARADYVSEVLTKTVAFFS
jgi:hypothetical protein